MLRASKRRSARRSPQALAAPASAAPPSAKTQSQTAAKRPAVDPKAVAALERMGEFLRKQQSLEVKGETVTDEVLPSGQKVQYGASVDARVHRPNRLRVD